MPSAFIAPPALGWNTRDPVATMRPGFAPIFDNYLVQGGEPIIREGWRVWATGLPGRVDGLLPWNGAGAAAQLFAASGTGIYSVTAGGAVGAAVVSGLTSARWNGINVAATGGNYLFAFNGVDTSRTFDGTTWASWGGTGVTGGVAWAGQFKGRMFVGNPSRLSFFYGGAGAIAGAFTEFPLQAIATRGGGVCAVATLSGDGGSGPQDLIAFITTEGEIIVYGGTDPSSTTTFALVGRWRVPRPIGAPHRCVADGYGGDALLVTAGGVLPLSALRVGADVAETLTKAAMTRRIAPTWRALTAERGSSLGWGITPVSGRGIVIINVPWGASAAQQVVVSEGGAVSRWAGINAAVWADALGGRVFAGDAATGRVLLWGEDIADGGMGLRSEALCAFATMGSPARVKRFQLAMPLLRDAASATVDCEVITGWEVPLPGVESAGSGAVSPALPPLPSSGALIWGTSLWDDAAWGNATNTVRREWQAVNGVGHACALRLAMTSGHDRPAWLGTNIQMETGGPVR
jgi:hypothetical protein